MLCKKCGAQIRREDKRPDGRYQCPGCGAVYRAKAKAAPDAQGRAANEGAHDVPSTTKAGARKRAARKPRLRVRWGAVAVAAGAVVVIAAAGIALALSLGRDKGQDVIDASALATAVPTVEATAVATPVPTAEPTATPVPEVSVNFRAVGDVMVHKLQLSNAQRKNGKFDFKPQFEYVKDALSKADYTIANLELSIAADDEYTSFPFFRTPEEILDALKDSGVDMLTMANNHILDGFYDGLIKTIDQAEACGFDFVGAGRTKQEVAQPVVRDINGIRFGFLAYTKDINDNDKRIEAEKAKGCVKRLDQANFKKDVQELRDLGAEVVICLPHWGDEGRRSIPASCTKYAQQMVEAGVDIILGSHPHVVLPINIRRIEVNGKKKDVLIAWSMGNFVSYMASRYMDSGIIVDFTVTRDSEGEIRIHDVGYVPVYVCGNQRLFRVVCSGDFYSNQPEGMPDSDYTRMKQSVREIAGMIQDKNVTMLQN